MARFLSSSAIKIFKRLCTAILPLQYLLCLRIKLVKMMKTFLDIILLLFLTVMVTAAPHDVEQAWKEYKGKFGNMGRVSLEGKDSTLRKEIFSRVHKMIVNHNSRKRTFTLEHNMFSVMTEEEKKGYLGYIPPSPNIRDGLLKRTTYEFRNQSLSTPVELDYRKNACLGPVKNQGGCGSCYAFATVASLEFSNCLLNGNKYVSLSEQQIVDCDKSNGGCGGGYIWRVVRHIQNYKGIDTTSYYPYVSASTMKNGTCKFQANAVGGNVADWGRLTARDPVGMKNALVEYGVLIVSLYVSKSFHSYKSGVYNDKSCDGKDANHAVNAVGYGRDSASGLDYWVLRNSWSSGWGQGGYMLIQRGVNKCGVENNIYYVVAVRK